MRRYFKRAIAVLAIALMCSTLIGGGVLAENESENDFNDELTVEEGVSYSGIESSSTYNNVRQEVSDFTLSTLLQSNNKWVDENHVFYYNFNLSKDGKGVNMSLPYQIVKGDVIKSEGVLEFENGIGAISLPTGYAMKSSKMPTGLSYTITHKPDSNFTWDKDTIEGTTDFSGSTVQFIAGQIYNPLRYSLDTDIIVKMDGRNFKAGDSFTYAVVAENENEYPPFNMFPLPSVLTC